jgi:hypothetical protein
MGGVEVVLILQADKGVCVIVVNESTGKNKISSLLKSGVYEILLKDLTPQTEEDTETSYQTQTCPSSLKHKLAPSHSKPHHLYGLPRYTNLTSHLYQ